MQLHRRAGTLTPSLRAEVSSIERQAIPPWNKDLSILTHLQRSTAFPESVYAGFRGGAHLPAKRSEGAQGILQKLRGLRARTSASLLRIPLFSLC
jgi:hypothetical protein